MDRVEYFTGGSKLNIGSAEGVGKSVFSNSTGENYHDIDIEYEKPLWVTGNTAIMDSSVCVLKGWVGILGISTYVSVLVKSLEIGKKVFTDMKSIPIIFKISGITASH